MKPTPALPVIAGAIALAATLSALPCGAAPDAEDEPLELPEVVVTDERVETPPNRHAGAFGYGDAESGRIVLWVNERTGPSNVRSWAEALGAQPLVTRPGNAIRSRSATQTEFLADAPLMIQELIREACIRSGYKGEATRAGRAPSLVEVNREVKHQNIDLPPKIDLIWLAYRCSGEQAGFAARRQIQQISEWWNLLPGQQARLRSLEPDALGALHKLAMVEQFNPHRPAPHADGKTWLSLLIGEHRSTDEGMEAWDRVNRQIAEWTEQGLFGGI